MSVPSPSLLVTGGAGFIGSCFVAKAVAQGAHVVVLDALTYAGGRDNLEWIANMSGSWQLVQGNICDGALVSHLLREHAITQVVNFAAESHVDNSILGPAAFIDTNIGGVFQLLEACRGYASDGGFRFLQVSTDEVFGSISQGRFDLDSPYRPNSPYSASKAAGDHLVRAWGVTYGLPVMITHCSNNYGPRQHPEKLIPTMIQAALAGAPLPLYGDGQHVRDWLHVEDHCEGLWLALTKGVAGGVYHFSGDTQRSNSDLVQALCRILDTLRPAAASYVQQIEFVKDRPGHDRRYALDDSDTRKVLGFAPKQDFSAGLEHTVAWYVANSAWCAKRRKA